MGSPPTSSQPADTLRSTPVPRRSVAAWMALVVVLALPLLVASSGASRRVVTPAAGTEDWPESLRPTRGYIVISVDTLRADHLSAYGYRRATSPFFDRLSKRRGALFEQAFAPYPSTLPSHVSLLTGYHPAEHGVFPPSRVLSEGVPTLAERFRAAGYRTGGFTEGGYVAGDFGFARGFDTFDDSPYSDDVDVETTFGRGLDFLRSLERDAPFFLFLHTYSVHDPYAPPKEHRGRFRRSEELPEPAPTGPLLSSFNRGRVELSAHQLEDFRALYDEGIRYFDSVLEGFFDELSALGLEEDLTVVITSDHGEEFLEHERLAHTQIYPEVLRVPLLVLHPDLPIGGRVRRLVELGGVAPTLVTLAELELEPALAARGLVPLLTSPERERTNVRWGHALNFYSGEERGLLRDDGDRLHLLVHAALESEAGGEWASRRLVFDTTGAELRFELQSFHEPRRVAVRVDGAERPPIEVGLTWTPVDLVLGTSRDRHRVVLETASCHSPSELGVGADERCLSFRIRGISPTRLELYDLTRDPLARVDVASSEPEVVRNMLSYWRSWRPLEIGKAGEHTLDSSNEKTLRALGYLD